MTGPRLPEMDDAAVAAARRKVGRGAQATLDAVRGFAQRAVNLLAAPLALRESAQRQVGMLNTETVVERLRETPVAALKDVAGRRVRIGQLERSGYRTVADVLNATAAELGAVPGIGPQTVRQAMDSARQAATHVHRDTRFRFDPDRPAPGQSQLLATLAAIRAADATAAALREPLTAFTERTTPLVQDAQRTGSRLRMFASGRATKQAALRALAQLDALLADASFRSLADDVAQRERAADPRSYDPVQLWEGYRTDAASVNALLSTVADAAGDDEEAVRGFIPEELRQQISAVPLDTGLLTATLRGYQVFGAQYAIHQQRSILGDEMGLGKTVQALAVFAHLAARGQRRFLVVCPASVQINWLNETAKHSLLAAHSLHGSQRDAAARRWLREGGVAVTTFTTLARLPAAVRSAEVAMLVVDEAHYVKNPDAARSRAVAAAAESAQRALFLTGTPMENRVEEFRNLVAYLQPSVAARVDPTDALGGARAFRRAVAPVYLRRNQEDVLTELPEKVEVEDWVQLSPEDDAAYAAAVRSRNMMQMRQAAYMSSSSAKLERLVEIVDEATQDGRKVVVFSYFLGVLATIENALGSSVVGTLSGAVPPALRQQMVNDFTRQHGSAVLLGQIEAGGVGLNVQAASVVVIAEPQWKPSTENQAIARAHRMGQIRTVQVHRLLAKGSVDERLREIQENKTLLFDEFARKSDAKDADHRSIDPTEHRPAVLDDESVPLERRVILAEEHRLARRLSTERPVRER